MTSESSKSDVRSWWVEVELVTGHAQHALTTILAGEPERAAGGDARLVPASGTTSARNAQRSAGELYLLRLAPGSRRSMRWALKVIAEIVTDGRVGPDELAWGELTYQDAVGLRSALVERGYSPATINKALAAWRGTLREAWRAGEMTHEQMARAADVSTVKIPGDKRGTVLDLGQVTALLEVCDADDRPVGSRDGAIVAVLYAAALRRAELCNLDLCDYQPDEGLLRVLGKGGRHRNAHLADAALRRLDQWVDHRGLQHGPLFCGIDRYQRLRNRRLNPGSLPEMLSKRGLEAGIGPVAPHACRRASLTGLLDAGVDLSLVQQVAGHASPATTTLYDRRLEQAKATAARRLPIPAPSR